MSALSISPGASPFPFAALATAAYVNAPIKFEDTPGGIALQGGPTTSNEVEIVSALAKSAQVHANDAKTAALFQLAQTLAVSTAFPDVIAALNSADDHLRFRTFLSGHSLTASDFVLWGAIKGSSKTLGALKGGQHPHVSRWYQHIEGLTSTQNALASLLDARAQKVRSNKTASSFALGLPNAIDGKVVTRFPPEPSGYLHIGHAKAAILNNYFAQMYRGKFIVRFDDTNPTKERTEFEETILEDLQLLGLHGDQITHTSDYFDHLYKCALEIINRGKAYADDTEQMQMRHERMEGIASKRRDSTVEDNLARFAEMAAGTEEGQKWCLRAKLSVDSPNKALRDPVIYRVNTTPHHRTGDKWKVYPTYDFACPIVDELEGVTHALRTNEYRDRNPQYHWMLKALGLRKVEIWDFSRLNFIYTLLSKRKLHMFVDRGLVEGWNDPRFPTVRGIRRRGLTIEAIKQYMLTQGPSQSVVSLEWDSIWSINKKIIDPVAPRYWALHKEKLVRVDIKGVDGVEVKSNPLHKKNPEVGTKGTVYGPAIYVEQEDAVTVKENEELTLMDWGNAFVRSIRTDSTGAVTGISMELHLAGDFKKTEKKITWLAEPSSSHPHIDVTLHDYDYLITKKKLEEDDDVNDFITPVTEFKTDAVADPNVVNVKKGDIIQFERKGYYILDAITPGERPHYKFVHIPDGKAASLASKAAPPPAAACGSKAQTSSTPTSAKSDPAIAVDTKMYKTASVYGNDVVPPVDTKMYSVKNVYDTSS